MFAHMCSETRTHTTQPHNHTSCMSPRLSVGLLYVLGASSFVGAADVTGRM